MARNRKLWFLPLQCLPELNLMRLAEAGTTIQAISAGMFGLSNDDSSKLDFENAIVPRELLITLESLDGIRILGFYPGNRVHVRNVNCPAFRELVFPPEAEPGTRNPEQWTMKDIERRYQVMRSSAVREVLKIIAGHSSASLADIDDSIANMEANR